MSFEEAFEFTFNEEGGYVNDPSDSGGETKYGISKRAWPNIDIPSLTKEKCKPLYRLYWDNVKGDLLPDGIDLQVFDFGFTAGEKTAIKLLQRLSGITQDGLIGPVTLKASKNITPQQFCAGRKSYYTNLAKRRPKDKRFLKGWKNRSDKALKRALLA